MFSKQGMRLAEPSVPVNLEACNDILNLCEPSAATTFGYDERPATLGLRCPYLHTLSVRVLRSPLSGSGSIARPG